MKSKLYTHRRKLILAGILLVIVLWTLWGNTALKVTEYHISSPKIPPVFSGFRIAQISDFHNADYWDESGDLVRLLEESKPDIIVITGDLIDSNHTDIERALKLASDAVNIAPTYYVTGNHEAWAADSSRLLNGLTELGVTVLDNKTVTLQRESGYIDLMGMDDPDLFAYGNVEKAVSSVICSMKQDRYTILLAHRPELFPIYEACGIDLTLAGHVHGGQFRLPFIGGLVGPNQGLFPEYDGGYYSLGQSQMVLSRGIGNSIIPIRFNNRPEIPLIILQSK